MRNRQKQVRALGESATGRKSDAALAAIYADDMID